ncbi:MAG TPA: (2Fe-2S)-binding protein [Chloroflexota bacterium]|nr:(2Fe-2S)-binding protein [Chloroflexota bacterium]
MEGLRFEVNGAPRELAVDAGRTLLSVLRDELDLTGAKYGCGEGRCGACVVLLDGEPVPACVTPVGEAAGRRVETVEGLAPAAGGALRDVPPEAAPPASGLHPVQRAFLEETALQCGYCTPGMIMCAVALLRRTPHPDTATIKREMEGHLCRCGVYGRIVRAVQRAAAPMRAWDGEEPTR